MAAGARSAARDGARAEETDPLARAGLSVGRMLLGRRFADALQDFRRAQRLLPDALEKRLEGRLAGLLSHAATHVPFWRDACRRLGAAPSDLRTLADLRRLPIVDKDAMRGNLDRFLAEGLPPWRAVENATSGSTGDPFRFRLDRAAMPIVFASHLFYDSWHGLRVFDRYVRIVAPPPVNSPLPPGTPLSMRLRSAVASRLQGTYEKLTQRRILTGEVRPDRTPQLVREIDAFGPAYLMGYTSTVAVLAEDLLARGIAFARPLQAVITIAETLSPPRQELIEKAFRAPIVSRYGLREFKYWHAQSCAEGGPHRFHVNTELVALEIVRADGQPAAPGESGRVVLTGLHNRVMPFLRYDTRDVAAWSTEPCPCGRTFPQLVRLEGRVQETVATPRGLRVNATTLGHHLFVLCGHADAVRHYQLVQRAADALELLVVKGHGWTDASADALARDVRRLFDGEMQVEVRAVGEIPLERSGKRPIIKPLATATAPEPVQAEEAR